MTLRSLGRLAGILLLTAVHAAAGAPGGQRQPQASNGSQGQKPATTQESDNYDLNATTMTLTHTGLGSVERLVANDTADAMQIGRARVAMRKLADNVSAGDYPTPVGARADAPGLAVLQSKAPGEVRAQYVEIRGGAEVRYTAEDPDVVAALHAWLDARLAARDALAASQDRGATPRSP
jgi:hypothetical protein